MNQEDWKRISQDIYFDYKKDSYFTELKESEILKERMDILQAVEPYIGRFYSEEWIKKNILRQSDDEIKSIQKQMQSEAPPPEEGLPPQE